MINISVKQGQTKFKRDDEIDNLKKCIQNLKTTMEFSNSVSNT